MIDAVLLGTGGMMPLPNRWLSSLLIRCESEMTLFDCGEGTQVPMRESGWGFKRLSSIVLSHLHADHVMGMTGVLFSVGNAGRTEPLTIYGPPGTLQVAEALTIVVPGLPMEVMVHEVEAGDRLRLPGESISPSDRRIIAIVASSIASTGLAIRSSMPIARAAAGIPVQLWSRLQHGETVQWDRARPTTAPISPVRRGAGFRSDSSRIPARCRKCPRLLHGVDLLVCEGTYGDDADQEKAVQKTHMTFREAATIAKESECR